MARRAEIVSPDGDRWIVSRQWVKGPKFRWGLRRKPRSDDLDWISPFDFIDTPSGIAATLVFVAIIAVVIAVTGYVVLPLLGLALEAGLAIVLLGYGIAARVLFRRPWIIEAKNLDDPVRGRDFKVVGWAQSREAIRSIEQLVASGSDLDSASAQRIGA